MIFYGVFNSLWSCFAESCSIWYFDSLAETSCKGGGETSCLVCAIVKFHGLIINKAIDIKIVWTVKCKLKDNRWTWRERKQTVNFAVWRKRFSKQREQVFIRPEQNVIRVFSASSSFHCVVISCSQNLSQLKLNFCRSWRQDWKPISNLVVDSFSDVIWRDGT